MVGHINSIRYLFLISFFIFNLNVQSQNISIDVNKAKNLYAEKKYDQAVVLFEKIYKKEKTSRIYNSYLDCLVKLSEFEKAIELVKNYYKKHGKNPSILIDLGELYILKGDEKLAQKQFENAIEEIEKKPNFILSVASNFYKKKNYNYALKAYLIAKEKNPNNYSLQISNIYSQLGQVENMYKELLDLLLISPSYLQTCKSRIIRTINTDSQNVNNVLLKKNIIKKLKKNETEALNDLLVWVYLQEKNFSGALEQLIALDKRFEFYENNIYEIGEISMSNEQLNIAESAFDYLIKKGEEGIYYEESILKLISIKYLYFKKIPLKTNNDIEKIIKEYENAITILGESNETILIIRDLAHIIAFYQKNKEKAKKILEKILEKRYYSNQNLAHIKIELGDILLCEGKKWDAILYYSQVEKGFKNDIIGQQAKFKKIKVDYFNGDFNWAQAQLDVLKKSTSKLISNNAIELSLLITDNLNLDTTKTALELYAKAELYIFQNNYDDALNTLKNIESVFPDHSLIDEVLFKKALISIDKKKYNDALMFLEKICQQYGSESILFDDALYKQGYILETIFEDKKKAKEKYERILLEQPGSIFLAEARKRYRKLRNN